MESSVSLFIEWMEGGLNFSKVQDPHRIPITGVLFPVEPPNGGRPRGNGRPLHITVAMVPQISAPNRKNLPARAIMPIRRRSPYCACRGALRIPLPPRSGENRPATAIETGGIRPLFLLRQTSKYSLKPRGGGYISALVARNRFGAGLRRL